MMRTCPSPSLLQDSFERIYESCDGVVEDSEHDFLTSTEHQSSQVSCCLFEPFFSRPPRRFLPLPARCAVGFLTLLKVITMGASVQIFPMTRRECDGAEHSDRRTCPCSSFTRIRDRTLHFRVLLDEAERVRFDDVSGSHQLVSSASARVRLKSERISYGLSSSFIS